MSEPGKSGIATVAISLRDRPQDEPDPQGPCPGDLHFNPARVLVWKRSLLLKTSGPGPIWGEPWAFGARSPPVFKFRICRTHEQVTDHCGETLGRERHCTRARRL